MTTSRGPRSGDDARRPRSVVKISGPADILGVLPHRLGFHPTESLVVVCLQGPRNRDRLVMRFDLPVDEHDAVLVEMVEQRILAIGATGAVLVVYTERSSPAADEPSATSTRPMVVSLRGDMPSSRSADGRARRRNHGRRSTRGSTGPIGPVSRRSRERRNLPREALIELLTDRLEELRIGVAEALLVHGGHWYSYHCANGLCCPTDGTPIAAEPTPAAARYAAETALLGNSVLPSRDAVARSFQPSDHAVAVAARRQSADSAGERLMTVADAHGMDGARDLVVATLVRLLVAWSDGDTAIDQDDASLIAVGLHDKRTRDEVMTFVLDHETALLVAVFSEIARRAADEDTAPICTVLAWAAYADGSGALAALAAERAVEYQPGYAMAELVLDGLSRMVPPEAIRLICRQVRSDLDGGESGAALGSAG